MNIETPKLSVADALARIIAIRDMQRQTGRMDAEEGAFAALLLQVQKGEITPEEGVAQANAIASGRQEGMEG